VTAEQQSELDRRAAAVEAALVWLAHWQPATYAARAERQGFPVDIEPAALARHEAATAMQVEWLS
jgi:hypothetical protein